MIKDRIVETLKAALEDSGDAMNLNSPEALAQAVETFRVEQPRNAEHGDYAVNVSQLARFAKLAPPQIAETLKASLSHAPDVEATSIAGFVNFRVNDLMMAQALQHLIEAKAVGKNDSMASESILLEYVSANPTGPLHIGHGRWAALGDSLVRIWRHCGATVTPEFYVNDAGSQMNKIARSACIRAYEILIEQKLQSGELTQKPGFDFADSLQNLYPGEYVIEIALAALQNERTNTYLSKELPKVIGFMKATTSDVSSTADASYIVSESEIEHSGLKTFAKDYFLNQQKKLLERMGVHFEAWFSEKEMIHDRGLIDEMLANLQDFTFEEEGALWFQSSEFGDEKDRVLKKSDGSYTYLTADIAYHHQKFNRVDDNGNVQYSKVVNIWGADHHGYIARLRGAMIALGHLSPQDTSKFEIILGQLVNLLVDGERERMGKRRKMVTLEDVVDEVGVDATRFWMVSKSANTTLDFDVDLAQSKTNENPVFYAQYAHARCCSILRNAIQSHPNVDTGETQPAFISEADLTRLEKMPTVEDIAPLFEGLDETAMATLKALIFRLDNFTDVVKDAARSRSPHSIAQYTLDLASDFHSFYNVCRILTPEPKTTAARLVLIIALRRVLVQALGLLGVSAPESM